MSDTKQIPKIVDFFNLGYEDAKTNSRRKVPKFAKKAYQNGYNFGQATNKNK